MSKIGTKEVPDPAVRDLITAAVAKEAGTLIYIMEELTDARLRCEQLKKFVERGARLISESPHRDHFYEVAGDILYGLPDALFRLDKALSATALAASRLDYEELKQQLKPEKVEELEDVLRNTRIRQIDRRSPFIQPMPQGQPGAPNPLAQGKSAVDKVKWDKVRTKRWMQNHVEDHVDRKTNEVNSTGLAEEAAQQFNIYEDTVDYAIPDELFDMSADVAMRWERENRTASQGRKVMFKAASQSHVAGALRRIASEVETGRIRPRDASCRIRRVLMALSQTAQEAVEAMGPIQGNSREEVMKGFKSANPDLTEEQLQEIADHWEKNKDVVKDQNK